MMKRYGAQNTNLELTERAQRVYNGTDPLEIWEDQSIDGFARYKIKFCGKWVDEYMTNQDVNEWLESLDYEEG